MNTGKPKEGLAIASLVLGVLALVPPLMFLLGLPAVITGHIAHRLARRSPGQYGGRRMALAGLITGYVGTALAVTIVVAVLVMRSRMVQMQQDFTSQRCISNLKQVGLAARVFSEGNKYRFPDTFLQMSNELGSAHLLLCPADTNHVARGGRQAWSETNISYEFVEPGIQEGPDTMDKVVFRCPIHGHVVAVDGTVQSGAAQQPGAKTKP
jgi:hypothetical protein